MRATDTLLTPETYAVLQRVPREWMDMAVVIDEIVAALTLPRASVSMRLTRLRELGLVERRGACQLGARSVFELRRAGDE